MKGKITIALVSLAVVASLATPAAAAVITGQTVNVTDSTDTIEVAGNNVTGEVNVTVSGVGDLTNTTVDVGTLNTSSPSYTYDIPEDANYTQYYVTVDGNTSYVGSVDIGTTQYATGGGGGVLGGDVIGSNPLGSNVLRAILAIVAVVGTGAAITLLSRGD